MKKCEVARKVAQKYAQKVARSSVVAEINNNNHKSLCKVG